MIGQTNAKIGSKINGTVKEYVVNTGNTIAKGDFVSIVSSGSVSVSSPSTLVAGELKGDNTLTINISDNKFLIVYNKNDNKLYAKVVNYTTTFDDNTETLIYNGQCRQLYAEKMSDGDIILSFIYNYNKCYMCRLHINGNSVEISIIPTLILSESASWFLFALLSDTLAVASRYYYPSTTRRAVIISISASTISILNNSSGVITLNANSGFVHRIDGTKCALTVGDPTNYYNRAYVITPNGSSLPTFSETGDQNKGYQISDFKGCRLNNKSAVIVGKSRRGDYLYISFISILDNNEVSISFPLKLNNDSIYTTSISLMDNDLLLISYTQISSNYGRVCVFDLKDNGIFDAITFNDTTTEKYSVARLNSTKGVVFYHNTSTANGEVRIVTLPTTYVKPYDGTGILGIAKTGGTAGDTIDIYVP